MFSIEVQSRQGFTHVDIDTKFASRNIDASVCNSRRSFCQASVGLVAPVSGRVVAPMSGRVVAPVRQ